METIRKTVFLVDDDDTNLLIGRNALADMCKVFTMTSAERMFELLNKIHPDLILLDIAMPGMDGYEALARLRFDSRYAELPIVLLSAGKDADSEIKGLKLGASDYIAKPFLPSVLRARISLHMNNAENLHAKEMLGMHDTLTGIANRAAFDVHLEREWGSAARHSFKISLMMIDIDQFKDYNKRHGRGLGDEMMRTVAGVIASYARRSTDMAVRMNKDEFALMLPGSGKDDALRIAERLRGEMSRTRVKTEDGQTTTITLSIGVAESNPSQGGSLYELIAEAQARLFDAKTGGRNKVC
ncbi:hypothetical protein FACS1894217_08730 [Clostridia bacterium]|nr:hypothetical protein FACS1894217_08730 [Clostridia bacterium]